MEKLSFDNGIKEYEVNGKEILRFNPSDPNVYNRFLEISEELPRLEEEYEKAAEQLKANAADSDGTESGKEAIKLLGQIDAKVKERLSYVFGAENDFDRILGGVSIMAVGENGERVVTNVFAALGPLIEGGVQSYRTDAAAKAVATSKQNREQRRAEK